MATTTKSKRAYRVLHRAADGGRQLLTVRITVGKAVDLYTVAAEYDGFGLACEWSHLTQGGRDYTCTVDHKGRALGCTCPARTFRCKHNDLTEVLVTAGHLEIPG